MSLETLCLINVAVLTCILIANRKFADMDPFHPLVAFLFFYNLYYVVRGFDLLNGAITVLGDNIYAGDERVEFICILVFLGIVFLGIGYLLGKKITLIPSEYLNVPISLSKTRKAHICFSCISLIAAGFLVWHAGVSPLEYVRNLNYYRLNVNNDFAYIKFLVNICGISGLLLYAVSKHQHKKINIIWLMLPFAVNIGFSHRHFAVYYIFSLIIIRHYLIKKISFFTVVCIGALTFVLNGAFATWRDYKYIFPDQEFTISESLAYYSESSSIIDTIVANTYRSGFTGFDAVDKMVSMVDENQVDYHYGIRFLMEPVVGAVPYSIWPDKPSSLAIAFNNLLRGAAIDVYDPDQPAGGIVLSIIGDLYWAGGIIGVCAGMLVLGFFINAFYKLTKTKSVVSIFVYAVIFPFVFTLAATIAAGIIRIFYFSIVVLIVLSLVRNNGKVLTNSISDCLSRHLSFFFGAR
jgi:oligosaccharide repeat unit polymerase